MLKRITALLFFAMAICVLLGFSYANENHVLSGIGENHVLYAQNSSTNIRCETTPSFLNKIKAETCTIDFCNFNLQELLDRFSAEVIMIEDYEDGTSYYAYSSKIKYLEMINGNKINLHIAVKSDGVKIGVPIIYASF